MFSFKTFNYNETVQSELKNALSSVLEKYGCREILTPVYTSINELLVNALKANYKSLYFENYRDGNSDNGIPYATALQLFRMEISSGRVDNLTDLAKKHSKFAEVSARVSGGVMFVEVVNQSEMTEIERQNVLSKLKIAEKIENIPELYSISERDPYKEGAGLGIVFVGIMLKSLGLPTENLQIKSENGKTTAFLTIPLTSSTVLSFRQYKAKMDAL